MASSVVEICNIALQRIGVGKVITAIDEGSVESESCNVLYDNARQRVLREARWPFSTRRQVLNLLESDPNAEWLYSYRYPSDAIVIHYIEPVIYGNRYPFEISSDSSGRIIYTDTPDATAVYGADMDDPTMFDPFFASALSWLMASELAVSHARKDSQRESAIKMYQIELRKAMASGFNESLAKDAPDSDLVKVRD